jgi:hypothetical protein
MMRRMLLSGEQYRWMDRGLYEKKLWQYERVLSRQEKPGEGGWNGITFRNLLS